MRRSSIVFKIELFSLHNIGVINCCIGLYFFRLGLFEVSELARALTTVNDVVHTFDRQMVVKL